MGPRAPSGEGGRLDSGVVVQRDEVGVEEWAQHEVREVGSGTDQQLARSRRRQLRDTVTDQQTESDLWHTETFGPGAPLSAVGSLDEAITRAIAEVATAVTKGDLTRSITVEALGEVAEDVLPRAVLVEEDRRDGAELRVGEDLDDAYDAASALRSGCGAMKTVASGCSA